MFALSLVLQYKGEMTFFIGYIIVNQLIDIFYV